MIEKWKKLQDNSKENKFKGKQIANSHNRTNCCQVYLNKFHNNFRRTSKSLSTTFHWGHGNTTMHWVVHFSSPSTVVFWFLWDKFSITKSHIKHLWWYPRCENYSLQNVSNSTKLKTLTLELWLPAWTPQCHYSAVFLKAVSRSAELLCN